MSKVYGTNKQRYTAIQPGCSRRRISYSIKLCCGAYARAVLSPREITTQDGGASVLWTITCNKSTIYGLSIIKLAQNIKGRGFISEII